MRTSMGVPPCIIQVMDGHDLVLKPMVTWGSTILRNHNMTICIGLYNRKWSSESMVVSQQICGVCPSRLPYNWLWQSLVLDLRVSCVNLPTKKYSPLLKAVKKMVTEFLLDTLSGKNMKRKTHHSNVHGFPSIYTLPIKKIPTFTTSRRKQEPNVKNDIGLMSIKVGQWSWICLSQ